MINLSKHRLSKMQINDAARYGVKVELEHTKSSRKAFMIAKQHEVEFPGKLYYKNFLLPMERRMKGGKK